MSLLEKYYPDDLCKIIGNSRNIQYIHDWIKNFYDVKIFLKKNNLLKKSTKGRKKKIDGLNDMENEYIKMKSCLVVSGPHGCGKSTIVSLLTQKINIINLNELSTYNTLNSNLIQGIYANSANNNNIILVDDWESIITSCDKKGIIDIIKNNNFNRWMPMIIITNNKHDKQITNIKKCSNEIKIQNPYPNEISKWMYNICKNEKINIEYELIQHVITYCQNDLRRILIFLNELNVNYRNIYINNSVLTKIFESIGQLYQSSDLFKATECLLSKYKNLSNCVELYKIDKTVVPLMIFENYHKYTSSNHIIMDKISQSDIFESYIFCEQNWDLLEIHGLISCGIPSYYINKHTNGKSDQRLIYATDLNKASVMRMNKKNKSNIGDNKALKNNIFTYDKGNTKKREKKYLNYLLKVKKIITKL